MQISLDLFAYAFVALAEQHVLRRLHAYHLTHGRDQRGISEVLSHAGNFLQHLIESVESVLLFELRNRLDSIPPGTL